MFRVFIEAFGIGLKFYQSHLEDCPHWSHHHNT